MKYPERPMAEPLSRLANTFNPLAIMLSLLCFISTIVSWIWKLPNQPPATLETSEVIPLDCKNIGDTNSCQKETELDYVEGMSELHLFTESVIEHPLMDSGFSSVLSTDVDWIAHSSLDNKETTKNSGGGGGAEAGGGRQDGSGQGGGDRASDQAGNPRGGGAGSGGDDRKPPPRNAAVRAECDAPGSEEEEEESADAAPYGETQSPGAPALQHQPPTSHQACDDNPVYTVGADPRVVLPQTPETVRDNDQGAGAPTAPLREVLRIRNGLHLVDNPRLVVQVLVNETIDLQPDSSLSVRDGTTLLAPRESEENTDGGGYNTDVDLADRHTGFVNQRQLIPLEAPQLTRPLFEEAGAVSHQDAGGGRYRRQLSTSQAMSIREETVHLPPRDTFLNLDRPPESDLEEETSSRMDMPAKKRSKNSMKQRNSETSTGDPLCELCEAERSDMALHPCGCHICQHCSFQYLRDWRMIGRTSRDPCPVCGQDVQRAFDVAQRG